MHGNLFCTILIITWIKRTAQHYYVLYVGRLIEVNGPMKAIQPAAFPLCGLCITSLVEQICAV